MEYKIEEYSNVKGLIQAIYDGKCPVIVAHNQTKSIVHAMVAYGVSETENNQFVKCKNSYGQDSSQPGNFDKYFKNRVLQPNC